MKQLSFKDRVLLGDSAADAHTIVFYGGEMVDILCPHREALQDLPLPEMVRDLFWDQKVRELCWKADRDRIVSRVLASGSWEAVRWLRSWMGDYALRDWIEAHRGRGLSPQRLRFWELILGLPHRQVSAWIASGRDEIWSHRTRS